MRKIIGTFVIMFVFVGSAVAQSDAGLTWSVQGVEAVKEISIDVDFTSRFISANGVVTGTNDLSLPITGTCFETANGGALCSFFFGRGGMLLLDLQSSLNGTVRTLDTNLIEEDSGTLTLTNLF